jgi:cell division septum initiation protein DivIVA
MMGTNPSDIMIGGMLVAGPQPPMLQILSPTTRNARAAQLEASRLLARVEQLEDEVAQKSADRRRAVSERGMAEKVVAELKDELNRARPELNRLKAGIRSSLGAMAGDEYRQLSRTAQMLRRKHARAEAAKAARGEAKEANAQLQILSSTCKSMEQQFGSTLPI